MSGAGADADADAKLTVLMQWSILTRLNDSIKGLNEGHSVRRAVTEPHECNLLSLNDT